MSSRIRKVMMGMTATQKAAYIHACANSLPDANSALVSGRTVAAFAEYKRAQAAYEAAQAKLSEAALQDLADIETEWTEKELAALL